MNHSCKYICLHALLWMVLSLGMFGCGSGGGSAENQLSDSFQGDLDFEFDNGNEEAMDDFLGYVVFFCSPEDGQDPTEPDVSERLDHRCLQYLKVWIQRSPHLDRLPLFMEYLEQWYAEDGSNLQWLERVLHVYDEHLRSRFEEYFSN